MEVTNLQSAKIFRGDAESDFVYADFNQFSPSGLQDATAFRYETQSGFSVETFNQVLPIFNPNNRSVEWYDFAPPALSEFCFFPIAQQTLQKVSFKQDPISGIVVTFQWYGDDASTVHLDSAAYTPIDPFTFGPAYQILAVVENQIQAVNQCFTNHENRILKQKRGRALLMAGKEYLVSQCEQEEKKPLLKSTLFISKFSASRAITPV